MYRLLVGFLHVLGPVQVGIAATMVRPPEDRRDIEAGLGVTLGLALVSWWLFRGLTARQAAGQSRQWFRWSYAVPLAGLGLSRLAFDPAVAAEWLSFRDDYISRPEQSPVRVGPWTVREVPASPASPAGSAGRQGLKLTAVASRELLVSFLRVLSSTPPWAYLGTLVVAACYRPLPKAGGLK